MIKGVVTVQLEAVVRLTVHGPRGLRHKFDAVIDTGFDGHLSLPPALIKMLRLPWRRRGRAILADGTETVFDIYNATLLWDRRPVRITVDQADAMPLIGMSLLEGFEMRMEVRPGGRVAIMRLR